MYKTNVSLKNTETSDTKNPLLVNEKRVVGMAKHLYKERKQGMSFQLP